MATGDADRRIEAIVEYLTGERPTADEDEIEGLDDPNYGGVWGAPDGRIVVAVVDIAKVDAASISSMAGGADNLHLIQVDYSFGEVNRYRDALLEELNDLDLPADVSIYSTSSGRLIAVIVEDIEAVPASFGADVPKDVFAICEGPILRPLE